MDLSLGPARPERQGPALAPGARHRYSVRMIHRTGAVHRAGIAVVLAMLVLTACARGPAGGLAIVDPVFASLFPAAAREYRALAGTLVVLPEEAPSAAMYAAIDKHRPSWVVLSPLLFTELGPLCRSRPELTVLWAGPGVPADHDTLYSATFSSAGAAAVAGPALADAIAATGQPSAISVALVSPDGAETVTQALLSAFSSADSVRVPIIERVAGWSQSVSERLGAMDVRAAYLAVDLSESGRWLGTALPDEAYTLLLCPLPSPGTPRGVDALVAWNLKETLGELSRRLQTGERGNGEGTWTLVRAGG